MTCLVMDGSSAGPWTAYPLTWQAVVSTPTRHRGPRTCDLTNGTTSEPSAPAAGSSSQASGRTGSPSKRVRSAAKGCGICGKPKAPGRGQRFCLEHKPRKVQQMCRGCKEVPLIGRGSTYCPECRPIYMEAVAARRRARERMNYLKPCRGCGGVKDRGRRYAYCAKCRRERQEQEGTPRPCVNDCGRQARYKGARLCVECHAAARELERERHRAIAKRSRERVARKPRDKRKLNMTLRMHRRLQREATGATLTPVADVTGGRKGRDRIDVGLFPALPSAPLAAAVIALIHREHVGLNVLGLKITGSGSGRDSSRQVVCERLGFDPRRLYAWETGEARSVQFDTADAILQKAGWLWFDVWEPCPGDDRHYHDVALDGRCQRCEDYCTAEEAFTSESTRAVAA